MSKIHRACGALGAALTLTTAVVVGAASAQAAAASWQVVYSTQYGLATDYSGYTTVIAPGPSDAWAFGANDLSGGTNNSPQAPVAVHWTGTAWQASTLPAGVTSEIVAASAVSSTDIWAVTQFEGDVLHWNGSAWSVATQLPGSVGHDLGQLTGVTAFSDTDVWVFGGSGFTSGLGTWHYDGSTWTQQTDASAGIGSASGQSATDIWATGSDGTAPQNEVLHYDGTAWQAVSDSTLTGQNFGTVLEVSPTDVWVSAEVPGVTGTSLVHFDGSTWSQVMLPWTMGLNALASDGAGGIWLSGQDSSGQTWLAQMTVGGTWSRTPIGSSGTFFNALALIPGTTSLWGAGRVDATTGSNATIWAYGLTLTPPAITSAPEVTFDTGVAGSFMVSASGLPAPTFAESGALPTGVTFGGDGVLSGTPAAGTGGRYPIVVTASNAAGSATQAFTLVVDVPGAPLPAAGVLGDVTGDGLADILAIAPGGNLFLYPNTGSGDPSMFAAGRSKVGSGWAGYTLAAVTPLYGSARAGILAVDSAGSLWYYPNTGGAGTSTFGARSKVGTGWNGYYVVGVTDLYGTGRPGLLAMDSAGNLWYYPATGGTGTATFGARSKVGVGWNGYTADVADINSDGSPDLLAVDAAGTMWLYPNTNGGTGTATFGARSQVSSGWAGYQAIDVGSLTTGASGADILGVDPGGSLWYYPNTGSSTFAGPVQVGSGWTGYTIN